MDLEQYKLRLREYKSSCEYLKQICSNKANKYNRYNKIITLTTLIATIVLSAIAFANKETVIKFCYLVINADCDNMQNIQDIAPIYDFIYNIIVVLILIMSVINNVCKFQEKAADYFHNVTTLSSMIRNIDSLLNIEKKDDDFIKEFNVIRIKYDTMLDYLPSHTDDDFIKAKYNLKVKNEISSLIKNKNISKFKIWFAKISLGLFLENKTKNENSNEK